MTLLWQRNWNVNWAAPLALPIGFAGWARWKRRNRPISRACSDWPVAIPQPGEFSPIAGPKSRRGKCSIRSLLPPNPAAICRSANWDALCLTNGSSKILKQRSQRQYEAKTSIAKALEEYNVGAVDTLIGDITPPDALMKTLTDRKLAEQERMTYNTQKEAEEVRKSLAQAKAQADTQPSVVKAERDVEIASFNAQAAIRKAEGEAGAKTRNAEADAMVLRTVGAAEGEKITAVGEAEAKVIKQKTAAMDPEKYASVEIARALAASGFKLVPEIVAGGGSDGNASGIVNVLLANIVRDSMNGRKSP